MATYGQLYSPAALFALGDRLWAHVSLASLRTKRTGQQFSHPPILYAAAAKVQNSFHLGETRCRTLRSKAIVFSHPKHSSIRFRLRWLIPYPACRVVRASIALPPRRVMFGATCGVACTCRHSATKSLVSYALSAPTVTLCPLAICSNITREASRSAVPWACNTSVLTISPLRVLRQ